MNRIWWFFIKNKHRRVERLSILLIYVFVVLIPGFYTYQLEIPPVAERHSTEGIAEFQYIAKGWLLRVNGIDLFCGAGFSVNPECYQGKEEKNAIAGTRIRVEWYSAKIYPFIHQNKVISIVGEAGVIRSEAETRDRLAAVRGSVWPGIIFMFFVFLGILFFCEKLAKRGDKQ